MVQEYGTYKEPGFREAGSPSVTTVFIALATVFVAMTTVFMQGELRTSEPWRRSSWEFSAHLAENTSGNVCCRCWRNLLERWFWQLFSCFYGHFLQYSQVSPIFLPVQRQVGFSKNKTYCHPWLIVRFFKIPVGLNRNSTASILIFYPIFFKLPAEVIFFKKHVFV